MKEIIKLTTISGEPLYLRDSYSIMALNTANLGEGINMNAQLNTELRNIRHSLQAVVRARWRTAGIGFLAGWSLCMSAHLAKEGDRGWPITLICGFFFAAYSLLRAKRPKRGR